MPAKHSIYLVLVFRPDRFSQDQWRVATTVVAATSSAEAETVFMKSMRDYPVDALNTYVTTDAAVALSEQHGADSRVWQTGAMDPVIDTPSYQRWQRWYLGDHHEDGKQIGALFRRFPTSTACAEAA